MADEPSVWERLKSLFGRPSPSSPAQRPATQPEKATPAPQPPVVKAPPVQPESPPVKGPLTPPSAAPPPPHPPPRPAPSQSATSLPPRAPATVRAPSIDLVLGIDFGTSCTKIVIGDPGWKDQAFPVPFGSPQSSLSSWLHPTRLGNEANLKMRLMDAPDCPAVRDLVACYLASAISFALTWFLENSSEEYRRGNWTWSLNLGFPGKNVESDSSLAAAYRSCAAVALQMVALTDAPTPELAARFRTGAQEVTPVIPPSRVHLYPEIAAQLAGYIKSPYRQVGNLLLIDVGAGTLDVSTLIIHGNQEEDIVSFHVCDVKPLGVLRLYQARAEALNRELKCCAALPVESFQDGCTAIPDTTVEMLGSSFHLLTPSVKRVVDQTTYHFASEVHGTVLLCLTRFRKLQRNAHENTGFDPWPGQLRFFLTGGGSRAEFYREQLTEGPLEEKLRPFTRWHHDPAQRIRHRQGLRQETMPAPRNLVGFPAALSGHFDRLSVAYGLAQGAENLMRLTGGDELASA